jgi:hypothetical protein
MADEKKVVDEINAMVPDGFDINVGRQMADGWARKGKGFIIQGRLLGRVSNDDKAYYQVALQKPCFATTGKGDEVQEVTLNEGQIVNVDESKALEDLNKYSSNGGIYDVWIMYGEKQQLPKGGSFWPVVNGPRVKMIKAPPKLKGDDIPF